MISLFKKNESGATLVEYGIASVLAIVVGGSALITLSGGVANNVGTAQSQLESD